jgi:hypothetical protein
MEKAMNWETLEDPIPVEDFEGQCALMPPFAIRLDPGGMLVVGDLVISDDDAESLRTGGCGCCASYFKHRYKGAVVTHVAKIEDAA